MMKLKVIFAIVNVAATLVSNTMADKQSVNVRSDFMKAMNEATQQANSMRTLQRKLVANATPRIQTTRALEDNGAYPLNLTDYSMKYVGCQNIKSFSDDLADDEDSSTVLGINKFVVFRLCEATKCSTYNKYGCQDNFGEYVIEMEYYLSIMSEYHHQTYLTYCETCVACMTPPEGMDDDTIYAVYNYTDDDAYNATNVTADSNSSSYTWAADADCEYYSACQNYGKACKDYDANADDDANAQMLGCQQVNMGNSVGYLGPHCGDDGTTLTLGFFRDEDCTELLGSETEFSYYTGMTLDDSWMSFYYNPSCVSCTNEESYGLYNGDDDAANGVYEMCEVLYEASAKCNRYLDVSDVDETYGSENQEDTELKVCNFVESLMENNYDEFGEIKLISYSFDFTNWNQASEYQKAVGQVSDWQIFGLVFSTTLMVGLFLYATYLYASVKRIHSLKNAQQYPTYFSGSVPKKMFRGQSGITMNRSGTFGGSSAFAGGGYYA